MFAGYHLSELMEQNKLTVVHLVKALGWASNRQYYQFVEGNPTAKSLEHVADYFGVPIDYFFDRDKHDFVELDPSLPSCSRLYERLLHEKDSRIDALERLLSVYEGRDKCGTKVELSSSENSDESR